MHAAKIKLKGLDQLAALRGEGAEARTMRWLAIALIGFALAPTLLTPIPAMVDYLNQIARMDILSRAGTPDANPFYETVWRLYPNLAMDLIAPFMAKALGPIAACRIFLFVSQILILSGAMALERVVKGRIALSPLAGCLFLYSLPFSFGFMNFEFGLGAALWGLAVMLAIDKRPAIYRLIVHAAFCALLFVAHFYAFGIYGAALGYYELARIRSLRSDYRFALGRFLLLAAPAAVLLVMLFMTGGRVGEEGNIWTLRTKPLAFFHILNGYNFYVSAVCMTILVAGGVYLAKSGFLRVSRVGVFMGIGFGVLYFFMPQELFGTYYADFRVLPAAALILPAFATISFPDQRGRFLTFGVVATIAVANIAMVQFVWASYQPEYRSLIRSFDILKKDARVLIARNDDERDPPKDLTAYPMYHAPTLAVAFANAFVPTVFTEKDKQPIRAGASVLSLDVGCESPKTVQWLEAIAGGNLAIEPPRYISHWTRDFDYLYVVGAHNPNPMPGLLQELAHRERFTLYRIIRGGGGVGRAFAAQRAAG